MRVAILGSGKGSNAEALLRAQQSVSLGDAKIVGIISDKENAGILALGEKYGVPSLYLNPGRFKTKLDEEGEVLYIESLKSLSVDLIVLAGFMRIIKKPFLEAFEYKFINLHPSLLPAFPGLDGIKQAYEYGVKYVGCTVHWVNETIDGGNIIDQDIVRVEEGDNLESITQKVHALEHRLLPKVIAGLSLSRQEVLKNNDCS